MASMPAKLAAAAGLSFGLCLLLAAAPPGGQGASRKLGKSAMRARTSLLSSSSPSPIVTRTAASALLDAARIPAGCARGPLPAMKSQRQRQEVGLMRRGPMPARREGVRRLRAAATREKKIEKFTWQLIPDDERIEPEESGGIGQVLAGFPIIGLVMQLATSEGGLDGPTLRFSEFARRILDNVNQPFYDGVDALRSARGPGVTFSMVTYALWTGAYGAGVMDRKDVINTNNRLQISKDLEYEISMYEEIREKMLRAKGIRRDEDFEPDATLKEQIELTVDCLGRLLALRLGEEIPEGICPPIAAIISECYPSATSDIIDAAIDSYTVRNPAKKSILKPKNNVGPGSSFATSSTGPESDAGTKKEGESDDFLSEETDEAVLDV